jgi:large subunit ribosomal protein L18
VIATASTLQADVKAVVGTKTADIAAAAAVGRMIAVRAHAAGVSVVAFDRAGFAYHGRVKALADAAREAGLVF